MSVCVCRSLRKGEKRDLMAFVSVSVYVSVHERKNFCMCEFVCMRRESYTCLCLYNIID